MIITSEILLSRKSPRKLASQVSCEDSRMQVVRFSLWTAAAAFKTVLALLSLRIQEWLPRQQLEDGDHGYEKEATLSHGMHLIKHVVNNKLGHLSPRNSCKLIYLSSICWPYMLACRMWHTRWRHECLQCEQEAGVRCSEHCGVSMMSTHLP